MRSPREELTATMLRQPPPELDQFAAMVKRTRERWRRVGIPASRSVRGTLDAGLVSADGLERPGWGPGGEPSSTPGAG